MRDLSVYFKNKKIDYSKLIKIGFIKRGNHYLYEKEMMNSQFKVIFEISEEKQESKNWMCYQRKNTCWSM